MMNHGETASSPADDEAARVLHQEIGLLPERYRSAVVLCYLEGLTHEAAAERLGRPVGTVRSRLATARDRLRARLTRRGLAPGVMPALNAPETVSSVVPAALEEATVRASLEVLFKNVALAGAASAEAVALMEGTVRTMTMARGAAGVASVIVAGFITLGVGAMAYSALTRDEGPTSGRPGDAATVARGAGVQEKGARGARSPAPETKPVQGQGGPAGRQGPIVIRAETVDNHAMRISGAALGLSVSYTPRRAPAESRTLQTVSDDEGRGRLEVVASGPGEQVSHAFLWAFKPGQALAVESIPIAGKEAAIDPVQLVLEEPLKRRIAVVGSDGRPIEGLRVAARSLQWLDGACRC